jgi:hypothetical protein
MEALGEGHDPHRPVLPDDRSHCEQYFNETKLGVATGFVWQVTAGRGYGKWTERLGRALVTPILSGHVHHTC